MLGVVVTMLVAVAVEQTPLALMLLGTQPHHKSVVMVELVAEPTVFVEETVVEDTEHREMVPLVGSR
jgi:hypothetical protein